MCTSFNKGFLYVRIHDGEIQNFFYPEEQVNIGYSDFKCKHIARIRDGAGEPDNGTHYDLARHGDRSGSGMLIEFRRATDTDINELLKVWVSRVAIKDWIKEVQKYNPELLNCEKERIARITKAH
ncbi:hypothetical protein A2V49_00715 [candidate division WWE3 bacterium RBG_19FT_COMBO_34_6]|uniref:Uncharacterized protein n=1 Tax=candidate division WWE3 bacterium RBG_19FT_COMBO_34_6 TaxID=1802612 RepID=A0A1F4UKC9_UNCKA|nr:MAG: hypothetical protein A2V49_00715 [candidate division WWE3 bacterium RBG_19FT_COMBO_34_6]